MSTEPEPFSRKDKILSGLAFVFGFLLIFNLPRIALFDREGGGMVVYVLFWVVIFVYLILRNQNRLDRLYPKPEDQTKTDVRSWHPRKAEIVFIASIVFFSLVFRTHVQAAYFMGRITGGNESIGVQGLKNMGPAALPILRSHMQSWWDGADIYVAIALDHPDQGLPLLLEDLTTNWGWANVAEVLASKLNNELVRRPSLPPDVVVGLGEIMVHPKVNKVASLTLAFSLEDFVRKSNPEVYGKIIKVFLKGLKSPDLETIRTTLFGSSTFMENLSFAGQPQLREVALVSDEFATTCLDLLTNEFKNESFYSMELIEMLDSLDSVAPLSPKNVDRFYLELLRRMPPVSSLTNPPNPLALQNFTILLQPMNSLLPRVKKEKAAMLIPFLAQAITIKNNWGITKAKATATIFRANFPNLGKELDKAIRAKKN